MSAAPVLAMTGVDLAYDGREVFRGLSLEVPLGSLVLLRGPSGAGKSTLLRLINRLEEPDQGEIRFLDRPLASFEPSRLRREACLLQQTPTLVPGSVRHNLLLPFDFKANADLVRPDDAVLLTLMSRVLLSDIDLDAPARALSVGQKQRLCLVRAVLIGPKLLLLDEPTAALDPLSRALVVEMVQALNRDLGLTVIMAGHQDLAPGTAPMTVTLRHGQAEVEA